MKILTSFALVALVFGVSNVTVPLAAQAEPVSATSCVEVVGLDLRNNCNYTIEVTWCVENGAYGYDCNGTYRGTWTLGAYGFYPHFGGTDTMVNYSACKGANSIRAGEGYDVFCE